MRTINFTSAILTVLFCCFFSVFAQAQFMKKLEKFAKNVEKTSLEIAKVNNTIQGVQKQVEEFTQDESEQDTSKPAELPVAEDAQEAQSSGSKSNGQNTASSNPQPKLKKPKSGASAVKIPGGQSKSVAINGGNATVRNMLGSYTIQVIGCEGNSSSQTVTITFMAEHGLANQSLFIYPKDTRAFAKGRDYTNIDRFVGSKSNNNMVPTEVPMECRVVIRNVISSVESFDSVILNMKTQNKDGGSGDQKGTLEFRNLKINWN